MKNPFKVDLKKDTSFAAFAMFMAYFSLGIISGVVLLACLLHLIVG